MKKSYEKPAVIFEKALESLAAECDPTMDTAWGGTGPNNCKGLGPCLHPYS